MVYLTACSFSETHDVSVKILLSIATIPRIMTPSSEPVDLKLTTARINAPLRKILIYRAIENGIMFIYKCCLELTHLFDCLRLKGLNRVFSLSEIVKLGLLTSLNLRNNDNFVNRWRVDWERTEDFDTLSRVFEYRERSIETSTVVARDDDTSIDLNTFLDAFFDFVVDFDDTPRFEFWYV
jgi:hypothetical protein